MKKEKFYQKLAAGVAWLLAVALLLPVCVGAGTTENVDTSKTDCSITINFDKGSTDFHLYRVASIDEQTQFTLVDPFTNYSVDVDGRGINDLTSEDYSGLALTLASYASADDLTPTAEGTTDQNGTYTFTNLTPGMYLLTGETLTEDGTKDGEEGTYGYTPTASLIVVPTWATPTDGGDLEYNYDPVVTVKYDTNFIPDDKTNDTKLKVMKEWNYSKVDRADRTEAKENQPDEVSVKILVNGEVYTDDSGTDYSDVELNESNNWSITLEGLSTGSKYSVVENDVDSHYSVSTSEVKTTDESGTTNVVLTLTNTYMQDDDPNDTTATTETPTATTEPTTASSGSSTSSSSSSSNNGTKLPQTGQLWWPVPVLALAGLVLFGAGSIRRSRSEKKEK